MAFTALLRQSRFCLTEVFQRTGEHDCAYPAVAPEGRAECAFRIIAQASRGRRSRPSDAPQFSKCNSDDRRQRRKQGGAVGAAASRMRGPHQGPKQTLGAATRAVARRRRDGEVLSWAGARQLQLSMQTKNHLNLKDSSGFLSMELLSRFELETSSLPRMRSTN